MNYIGRKKKRTTVMVKCSTAQPATYENSPADQMCSLMLGNGIREWVQNMYFAELRSCVEDTTCNVGVGDSPEHLFEDKHPYFHPPHNGGTERCLFRQVGGVVPE